MIGNSTLQSVELDIKALESKIDCLVRVCAQLKEENISLKNKQTTLTSERAQLVEKNELARVRVEAILNRLRGMERNA